MKLSRNSKIFINYFLGPLIFIWLSWSIYQQVKKQPELGVAWQSIKNSFSGSLIWNLVLVILLMLVNWSLEAVKWKISVRQVQEVSFGRSFKAILSGVSFAVSTPNRIGEYLGRMLYMNEGNRLRTISVTIVGSMSQLIITCVMGITGLLILRPYLADDQISSPVWFSVMLSGIVLFTLGLLLFYFRLSWITRRVEKIPAIKKFTYLVSAVDDLPQRLLFQLLALSLLRFFVFIAQYTLLFPLFAVDLELWQVFWGVSVSFLVMAAIPTIAIIELPLRGATMTMMLGMFSGNHLGIGLTTAVIWLVNLVIPAIAGSLMMLALRRLVRE
jgi:hypothetical protein